MQALEQKYGYLIHNSSVLQRLKTLVEYLVKDILLTQQKLYTTFIPTVNDILCKFALFATF